MLLDDKGFVLWSSEGACPGGGVHLLDYNVSLLHLLVEEGVFQEVDVEKDWEGLADQAPFAASGRETMQVGYHGDKQCHLSWITSVIGSAPIASSILPSPPPPSLSTHHPASQGLLSSMWRLVHVLLAHCLR